ncbi:MAG: ATP-grasp domain-containing protein [Acidimicrobiia bacterium]|nr:ATP-grasp domain-containing protein [Acidimicrobiia bacterium]
MRRLLLILPASTYRAEEFIEAAESVGAEPIVATDPHPLLQMRLGDRFIDLTEATPETIAADASAHGPVHGVVSPDDGMVQLAGEVAERLGVAANPPWAVGATRNKSTFRRALAGVVPQPSFQVLEPGTDPRPDIERIGAPVVMKPLSRSGSQGVIRVDHPDDAIEVEQRIRRILAMCGADPNEPILIERFVPGPEVAVEGILVGGTLEVLATFDKPDPLDGPYFEETIYVAPSRLHPEVVSEIHRVVQEACTSLGLVEGPVHAELRVHGSTVVMIEMAARPIGGRCGTALRFGLGDAQEVLLARAALGLGIRDSDRLRGSVGSLMIPIPASGTLLAIDGVEEARAIPGITGVDITAHIGGRVLALPEGDRYLGFAYAATETPEETEAALRAAKATITVEVG